MPALGLLPSATTIAVLVNPTSPSIAESFLSGLQAPAALGLELHALQVSTERDLDAVFSVIAQLRADAVVISPDVLFNVWSERLAALAVHHAVPAIYQPWPMAC
jgi:putative tryptophan/tyrosine transport system substrate-binding protein